MDKRCRRRRPSSIRLLVLTLAAAAAGQAAKIPTPPQYVLATPSNTSVSLSWQAPKSDGGAAVTGYAVYLRAGGSGAFAEAARTVPPKTAATVAGLTNGQRYDLQVVAINPAGNSLPSETVSTTPFTTPGPPTGLTAVAGPVVALVTTLAGNPGACGHVDGSGAAARFCDPKGIAADKTGSLYVADSQGNRIRKITPAGVVTTVAGTGLPGHLDGPPGTALFRNPSSLVVDAKGNLYITDSANCVIRKIAPDGAVGTFAGSPLNCKEVDGPAGVAQFDNPSGIALDAAGNVYTTSWNGCTVRKIAPDGTVSTLAGLYLKCGSVDGPAEAAQLFHGGGLAVDSKGNVFVAGQNGGCTIRKITGAGMVSTLTGSPGVCVDVDGAGGAARFANPNYLAIDRDDNLYVTDALNGETNKVIGTIRKITPAGVVTTIAGSGVRAGASNGGGSGALFNEPEGIAVDASGSLYVADRWNRMIRKLAPDAALSVFVTFAAPTSDGGSPVIGYTVASSPAGWADGDAGTPALRHTVTAPLSKGGSAYAFTAVAVNVGGSGGSSEPSNAVIPSLPAVK